ncbi:Anti sigma-E protein RseA [Imhoffiella purpurea]|uniref:Anti sigma-E protein RseA n=2 Tax=Imhoffiella purpurea TaxID=1249627 RepID=W9V589_9GAMM|nr:Anti sigma-E protein RseA [Imhoffiella purpurea]
MTDEHKQRLSELQDGELDSASVTRLLDTVAYDDQLRASWERYHLIGQAIRGEPIGVDTRRIADRVRCTLQAEPAILAHRRRRSPLRQRVQRMAGMALAASVAFAVFLMGPVFYQDALQDTPPAGASSRFAERDASANQRWHQERVDVANKLDLFLVTHQAAAPMTGAKGMLPYATLVGYEVPR